MSWRAGLNRVSRSWTVMVILAAVALAGAAKVGEDVFAHESATFDGAVQRWILAHQLAVLDTLFYWITTLGGLTGMYVLAALAAAWLWYLGRRGVAASMLAVPVIAFAAFNIAKRIYARPRPLGLGGRVDSTSSFPSGHATVSAAVCCSLAYLLWRERLIGGRVALALAVVVPLLVGISRLYLNVHWATDVLGGWSVGLLIAVLTAALYDRYWRPRHTVRQLDAVAAEHTTPSSVS